MHATRYGAQTQGGGLELEGRAAGSRCAGRTVLVLDDILDEGETLRGDPRPAARAGRGARAACAVLADKDLAGAQARSPPISSACTFPTASSSAAAWTRRAPGATCRRSTRDEGIDVMLAIIGGSGLTAARESRGDAPQGGAHALRRALGRADVRHASRGREVVFLARHGYGHTIPPHEVNYRANIWALQRAGRRAASCRSPRSAASAPTSARARWSCPTRSSTTPGAGARPSSRAATCRSRTSISPQPYRRALRAQLLAAARACGEAVIDGGVYAATQGPRLETAAEIDRLERDGADIVGMTGMPEAALARELELRYAAIAVVVELRRRAAATARSGDPARAASSRCSQRAMGARAPRSSRQLVRAAHDPRRAAHGRSAPARAGAAGRARSTRRSCTRCSPTCATRWRA